MNYNSIQLYNALNKVAGELKLYQKTSSNADKYTEFCQQMNNWCNILISCLEHIGYDTIESFTINFDNMDFMFPRLCVAHCIINIVYKPRDFRDLKKTTFIGYADTKKKFLYPCDFLSGSDSSGFSQIKETTAEYDINDFINLKEVFLKA
jgi:hypothetical protein